LEGERLNPRSWTGELVPVQQHPMSVSKPKKKIITILGQEEEGEKRYIP
jgi:hypothetical protein